MFRAACGGLDIDRGKFHNQGNSVTVQRFLSLQRFLFWGNARL